ncbi:MULTISPECIES: pyrroloquinoline quinone precursor peptide PqqA [Streptomyces]|uniref:Coenzyme PQQ synthesis protein A n=2 Tax=Streptomyces TaxID=1883 RepID=A0ABV9ILH9_9ACTN
MTDTIEQPEQSAGTITEQTDKAPWQTPGYTVVDTALEVTAYFVSTR